VTRPVKRQAIGSGSKPTMGKNFQPKIKNQKVVCSKCSRIHERIVGKERPLALDVVSPDIF